MNVVDESSTQTTTRTKRNNHSWNAEQDAKLVEFLVDMSLTGWKVDTGFRVGYLGALENKFEAVMPGCGIKGVPNIQSRIKLLKSQTMAIYEMLTKGSGFTWCDTNKYVNCEKVVYDRWTLAHPAVKGLFKKPFPHYDALLDIFLKDRANGGDANSIQDAEAEIMANFASTQASINHEEVQNLAANLGGSMGENLGGSMGENLAANLGTGFFNLEEHLFNYGISYSSQPTPPTPTSSNVPLSSSTPTSSNVHPSSSTPTLSNGPPSTTQATSVPRSEPSDGNRSHKGKGKALKEQQLMTNKEVASSIASMVECSKGLVKAIEAWAPPNPISKVAETLMAMKDLTRLQKMRAAKVITKEPSFMELFLMCNEEDRLEIVEDFLAYSEN